MYKFRTMTDERDENGELLPDSVRLTKFGRLLRSTSLDELPELFNILKGDMSIVGPRPLLVQYLPLYNDHQKRRHEVRPGLTGLAQVNGRNSISWEEKFDLDVRYVDHVSFIGDWKIILLTVKKVFVREGINSETAATMEPFTGNKKEDIVYEK
jgi:lipopolysaccharide/colanic/teichoic acid biosynthesis glycosyltransferase